LLGFPPVLLSDIEKDLKPRLRTLKKVWNFCYLLTYFLLFFS
jgi:hypothetical protein